MLILTGIRYAWPETAVFIVDRKKGRPDYSFVHFIRPAEVTFAGQTITVAPHTCILWRPGTPQHYGGRSPLLHDWFHFKGELPESLAVPADTLLYPRRTDFIAEIVREMETEFFAHRDGGEQLIDLKIRELFLKLSRELDVGERIHVDQTTVENLQNLREIMFRRLYQPWTAAEMANRMGLGLSRFYEVYRSVYGTAPIDDLIRARVDAACQLLLDTTRSVADIAESLGYTNVSHFIRQFKQITGQTPARYRRESDKP